MEDKAQSNLEIARRYLALLERDVTAPELRALFSPDFTHREFPNRLNPQGRTMTRPELEAATLKAAELLVEQTYSIRHAITAGDEVALEVDWRGSFKVPFGKTPAGTPLSASFGMFLTFRDGRIASQRNYDCFEPF